MNIKDFIKKNKGAIISCCTFILSFSDLLFNWILGDKTILVCGYNITAIIGTIVSIVIAVCTYGWKSPKTQEVIDNAVAMFKQEKTNGLTSEEVTKIKKKITELEKELDRLTIANKTYIEDVETFNIATEEERKLYDEYKVAKARITVMINQLKAKIESKK